MGKLFIHLGQPRVIGEMVAGIMLGPSLLGQIWPAAMDFILPADCAPFLGIIAQIGVILYMFLVGLELNAGLLRSRAHATVAISHTSILVPFLLGIDVGALAVSAPGDGRCAVHELRAVHGRGDVDHGLSRCWRGFSPIDAWKTPSWASIALSCAAIDDVTAWCLLAFVVGVAQAKFGGAVQTICWRLATSRSCSSWFGRWRSAILGSRG